MPWSWNNIVWMIWDLRFLQRCCHYVLIVWCKPFKKTQTMLSLLLILLNLWRFWGYSHLSHYLDYWSFSDYFRLRSKSQCPLTHTHLNRSYWLDIKPTDGVHVNALLVFHIPLICLSLAYCLSISNSVSDLYSSLILTDSRSCTFL
jgi:hypothetical protein